METIFVYFEMEESVSFILLYFLTADCRITKIESI